MPSNLYGPGDNFDLQNSHVIPALLAKFHTAKVNGSPTVSVWGSGRAQREFLHVDDAADGIVFAMKQYSDEPPINLGPGQEIPIADLAELRSAERRVGEECVRTGISRWSPVY